MSRKKAFYLLALAIGVLVLGWLLLSTLPAAKKRLDQASLGQPDTEPAASTVNHSSPEPATAQTACLSIRDISRHPKLEQELQRHQQISVMDETLLEPMRPLSNKQLQSMADTGDTLAMVMLGARAMMRASRIPEDKALDYLLPQEGRYPDLWGKRYDDAGRKEMEESQKWFYQAALHGRLQALSLYGQSLFYVGETPVTLGWMDQARYEQLSIHQRNAWNPSNLYGRLMYDIAPELKTGFISSILHQLAAPVSSSEETAEIRAELAQGFYEDRFRLALDSPKMMALDTPDVWELISDICEEDFEAMLRAEQQKERVKKRK